MPDIMREIKEEINQERLRRIIIKFLPYFAVAVAVFIAVFAIGIWYNNYKLNNLYKDGGIYLSAINKIKAQNLDDGLKKFREISDHDSNYAALAKFNLVSYAIFNKDFAKGSEMLHDIEKNSSYHLSLRHLATLLKLQIDYESDLEDAKNTINKLEAYIKSNTEFKYSAQEFLAALYLKENKNDDAVKILNVLATDSKAPSSISVRAQQYMALIK